MLVLTHECNLECRYCFVSQKRERMSLDTAKLATLMLLDGAKEDGVTPEINFFGGEPMLLWDEVIVPLTVWIREELKEPFRLSMTSNCTLLNDERLAILKKYGVGLLFSLDGAKKTQDYNRPFRGGRGSFDALADKIPAILKAYPAMTLRMTVIPATAGNLFENIVWGESVGYTNFFAVPNVFEPWDEKSRTTLREGMGKYGEYYVNRMREGGRPIFFSSFEDALRDIKRINSAGERDEYRCLPSCSAYGKCGLGASRFASVHPNGDIYSCQELTSNEGEDSPFFIGSVETGVSDGRRLSLIESYDPKKLRGDDCGGCLYDRICDGGCVANNYMACGSVASSPEMFCFWRRLLLDEAIKVARTLGGENNEAFIRHWKEAGE